MKWLRVHADGSGLTLARLTRFDRASTAYVRVFPGAAMGPGGSYATITRVEGLSRAGADDVEAMFAKQYGNCRAVPWGDEVHFHVTMKAALLWAPIMQQLTTARGSLQDLLVRINDGMIDLFALAEDEDVDRWAANFQSGPGQISILDDLDTGPWTSIRSPEHAA